MLIVVPSSVLQSNVMPIEVQNYISPQVWNQVTEALRDADKDSNNWACIVEWGVCLCIAFPCIFCCHGVIFKAFSEQKRTEKLNNINKVYFFSNPVFSSAELQGLIINTDYINRDNNQYSPPVTPAYVHVTSFGDAMNPLNSGKDADSSERTWSVSSAVASKVMTVTIPEGGRPGTVLTVATPDGTVVNVTIPNNVYPGQRIEVNY